MLSNLAQVAGELSLLGLGRPTDLLKLTFTDPSEQIAWDNAILTRALELIKAKQEGKSAPDEDRKRKMLELMKDKQQRKLE